MRKERKKEKGGKGAEDIDLGPSKKQLRKLRKEEKRKSKGKRKNKKDKKKDKKKDNGDIEF